MKLDFNIQINQKQGLALTAQVQQAIKLLQMTNHEILEFVEDNFQDNPFIETNEHHDEKIDTASETTVESVDQTFDNTPYKTNETESKLTVENQFETGDPHIKTTRGSASDNDFDSVSLVKNLPKSLYTHCLDFIESLQFQPIQKVVALRILEEIEPTGWISNEILNLHLELRCDARIIENVILKLQDIEPAGLFARNLRECLILQAKDQDVYSAKVAHVLDNLHLIANGKFDLLKRRCNCSDEEIANIFKLIKSFDPKPGLRFDSNSVPIREPDLIVKETDDEWVVELNNSSLPDIKIVKSYASNAKENSTNKKDREFIQNKVSEAKWLVKAIEKRNNTMIKVGSEIVKRQKLFLEKGTPFIRPMVLKDIAEAVGMHESTISRVTTGSLIQTPQGTLELKAFFSVGLVQDNEDGIESATSIKFKIKKLIENEDPSNPVSDDGVVEILAKDGVTLARRTVAKYRKLENIPSSFARKRRNVISGIT